ncbi:hypothetical protein [Methylobacterium sp. E-045]|uniref:hypothetical protein n=1 Tax=Methylobacterium sp. E-045 TaxID=2836575 RepID=UPI001FBBF359|nr:hypothetical protein [Methylobacterium sp. E-045]MCJ2131603.1 hypothetical protein [Methylobacterium sp. E-045]
MSGHAMALFRDLTRTIAEIEGLSEMTVTGVGQYLRDAGMISKHGRGRAAAQMTCEDAVNLLIGVNATGLAKEATEVVPTYLTLTDRADIHPIEEDCADEDELTRAMFNPESSGQCLVGLMKCFVPKENGKSLMDGNGMSVFLSFQRPEPYISLWIGSESNDPEELDEPYLVLGFGSKDESLARAGDRRDKTTITEKTLAAVGRLLTR